MDFELTPHDHHAAGDALADVIGRHIATGQLVVPDGATFVDADTPWAGRAVADALDAARPVVLVTTDGARRTIPTPAPASA